MKKAPHVIGPLWLPPGSVRALLAFFVVFVTCWLMVRDEELPLALSEALFTVLAYYFATRAYLKAVEAGEFHRTGSKEFAAMARGFSEATANPLYLPVGTIRVAVILAFVGVALYLAYSGGLNKLLSATTLLLVFAFFAGQIMLRGSSAGIAEAIPSNRPEHLSTSEPVSAWPLALPSLRSI